MGGQLGRIPSILSIQLGRIPSILSIPDTVSVRWYVWGDNSGGSRGHCVCEVVCFGGTTREVVCMGGQRTTREVVCMGGQLGILPRTLCL